MAYSKQDWNPDSSGNPKYINPSRMNHIEHGIYNNSVEADKVPQLRTDLDTLTGKSNIITYSNVSQLGLSGTPTIAQVVSAMSNGSMLVCEISQFSSGQFPVGYGVARITKQGGIRVVIEAWLVSSSALSNYWQADYNVSTGTVTKWVDMIGDLSGTTEISSVAQISQGIGVIVTVPINPKLYNITLNSVKNWGSSGAWVDLTLSKCSVVSQGTHYIVNLPYKEIGSGTMSANDSVWAGVKINLTITRK